VSLDNYLFLISDHIQVQQQQQQQQPIKSAPTLPPLIDSNPSSSSKSKNVEANELEL
jgi:hypothetical protein